MVGGAKGAKSMVKIRVEKSFDVDETLSATQVFQMLADSLFTADALSNQLENADVASKGHSFKISVFGVADDEESARRIASAALAEAVADAGLTSQVAA